MRNVVATAALLALGATAFRPSPAEAAVELTSCQLPGLTEEVRCGTLQVPEDRGAPTGRKIALNISVLPALGNAPAADPVFAIPGGPGESAVALAAVFAQLLQEARAGRDVVLVDVRGTGGSNRLHCPLQGSDEDPQGYLGDFLPVEPLRECLQKLDANPALYTTSEAVADLEDVRAALGYPKINLYGFSYGTRTALVYLRNHPERVRSAVLQGVAPTDMKTPLHHAEDSQRSLDLLLADCAADEACRTAYPRLKEKLAAVEARLAETPAAVEIEDPKTKKRVRLTISRDLFNEELRWRLYGEGPSPIPEYIQRASEGDFSKLAATLLRQRRAISSGNVLSIGTFLSVTCAEDVPLIDPEEARRLAQGTFLGTYRVDQQARACSVWPRGKVSPDFAEAVRSDVPVLLMSGERDPATPPRWGEQVARGLIHARHVIFPGGAHIGRSPCVRKLLGDFFNRGTVEGLDTACVQEPRKTAFVLPEKTLTPDPKGGEDKRIASAEGLWEGEVYFQRGWLEVELLVELFQGGPTGWAGNTDLPRIGLEFYPLTSPAVDGRKVSFEIHHDAELERNTIHARFEGELSEDGKTIAGTFTEEGKAHDFALRRIGEAGADRPVPVHPDLQLLSRGSEELRDRFNREQDKLRLILLLSPT